MKLHLLVCMGILPCLSVAVPCKGNVADSKKPLNVVALPIAKSGDSKKNGSYENGNRHLQFG